MKSWAVWFSGREDEAASERAEPGSSAASLEPGRSPFPVLLREVFAPCLPSCSLICFRPGTPKEGHSRSFYKLEFAAFLHCFKKEP